MSSRRLSDRFASFSLDDLRDSPLARRRALEDLRRQGGLVVSAPGVDAVNADALRVASAFFARPDRWKARCDGAAHYGGLHGDRETTLYFDGQPLARLLAAVLGSERGWVRRTPPSGAFGKQYFQCGVVGAAAGAHPRMNIWPDGEAWRDFRAVKERQLDLHAGLHSVLFGLMDAVADRPARVGHEVIIRDTLYPGCASNGLKADATVPVRNGAHVDLSDGTLVGWAPGLQVFDSDDLLADPRGAGQGGWRDVERDELPRDSMIYLVGLAAEIRTVGELRAKWHRVVASGPGQGRSPRLSTVSFGNAGVDDVLGGGTCAVTGVRFPRIDRTALTVTGNRAYIDRLRAGAAALA